MIVTVTLNPAIDKTCRMARMISGQVNRMDSMTSIAGGKGVNVTKILRQYGYEVTALGFCGISSCSLASESPPHGIPGADLKQNHPPYFH